MSYIRACLYMYMHFQKVCASKPVFKKSVPLGGSYVYVRVHFDENYSLSLTEILSSSLVSHSISLSNPNSPNRSSWPCMFHASRLFQFMSRRRTRPIFLQNSLSKITKKLDHIKRKRVFPVFFSFYLFNYFVMYWKPSYLSSSHFSFVWTGAILVKEYKYKTNWNKVIEVKSNVFQFQWWDNYYQIQYWRTPCLFKLTHVAANLGKKNNNKDSNSNSFFEIRIFFSNSCPSNNRMLTHLKIFEK